MQNRVQLKELLLQFGYDEGMLEIMNKGCDKLSDFRSKELLSSLQLAQESLPELLDVTDGLIKDCKARVATPLSVVSSKSIVEIQSFRDKCAAVKVRKNSVKLPKDSVIQKQFQKQNNVLNVVINTDPVKKDNFFDISYRPYLFDTTFNITKMYFDALDGVIDSFCRPYKLLLNINSEKGSESANLKKQSERSPIGESASNAKALMGAKYVQEALNVQAELAKPNVDKAVAYSKSLYQVSAEAQEQFTKMVEAQFCDFQTTIAGMLDQATKSAPATKSVPAGSETAVAAVKSAFAAANSAFDNMRKSAQQMTEIAQTNMAAATSATTKAAKKATGK